MSSNKTDVYTHIVAVPSPEWLDKFNITHHEAEMLVAKQILSQGLGADNAWSCDDDEFRARAVEEYKHEEIGTSDESFLVINYTVPEEELITIKLKGKRPKVSMDKIRADFLIHKLQKEIESLREHGITTNEQRKYFM